uniref:Uncharacterized protein n=1 Tax=Micromonas commoda virus TaxID=3057169 RepID=A0AAU7YNP5_9PHYC|tara:strand:+ start:5532 stop:5828 length:297 start_codon:yes stop_codon:yes gene_type:complete
MSTQPETIEPETETESESESEILPDQEVEGVDLTEYDPEDFPEDDDDFSPMENLLGQTLTTPEGDTVCTALVYIGQQMEIQNKIFIKLLNTLQKKNEA